MVGLIVIGVMLAIFATVGGFSLHEKRQVAAGRATPVIVSSTSGLSPVAKQVYKEYMALPADSRPFPEILPALRALDAQTEPDATQRRRHFDDNWLPNIREQNGPHRFNWNPYRQQCSHYRCKFSGYYTLHDAIADVDAALKEKERMIALKANQHGVDMLKELESALRSEAGIQRQVVKELS